MTPSATKPLTSASICSIGLDTLAAADVGNDAVRAEVVATYGDGDPSMPWVLPRGGQVARKAVGLSQNLYLR